MTQAAGPPLPLFIALEKNKTASLGWLFRRYGELNLHHVFAIELHLVDTVLNVREGLMHRRLFHLGE